MCKISLIYSVNWRHIRCKIAFIYIVKLAIYNLQNCFNLLCKIAAALSQTQLADQNQFVSAKKGLKRGVKSKFDSGIGSRNTPPPPPPPPYPSVPDRITQLARKIYCSSYLFTVQAA